MSEEIGLIYISLSQLLDDICVFLRDGVTKEAFSAETKKQAETLIRRSKTQLQQISNLTNGECYMPMENEQNKVEEEEEEEDDLIYMDAEEPPKEVPVENNSVCPFAGIPAKDLPLMDKHGFISLKTKLILRFEKWKKIFAAIHEDWFLIYYNDKESKPSYTYSLRMYRAKRLPTTKQTADDTTFFGLVHLETEQMLQFAAQTHKDMVQWITRINRYHHQDTRQLNITKDTLKVETFYVEEMPAYEEGDIEDEDEEHYDSVILRVDNNKNEEPFEDEEIYEVIRPPSLEINETIPKPSDISTMPKRRPLTPLPPLPVEEKGSTDSMASYDNPINFENLNELLDNSESLSFSEESEEEDNYDVLVTSSTPQQNTLQGKTSIYPLLSTREKEPLSSITTSNQKPLGLETHPSREIPTPPKKVSTNIFPSSTKENKLSPMNLSVIQELRSVQSPMRVETNLSSSNGKNASTSRQLAKSSAKETPLPAPMNLPMIKKFSPNRKSTEKPNIQPKPQSNSSKKENQDSHQIHSSMIQQLKLTSPMKSPSRDEFSATPTPNVKPYTQPKLPSYSSTKENRFPHQINSSVLQQLKPSSPVKSTMRDELDEFPPPPPPNDFPPGRRASGKFDTQPKLPSSSSTKENQVSHPTNSSVIQQRKLSSSMKSPVSDEFPPPPPLDSSPNFPTEKDNQFSQKSSVIQQLKQFPIKPPIRDELPPPPPNDSAVFSSRKAVPAKPNIQTKLPQNSTRENQFPHQINSSLMQQFRSPPSIKSPTRDEFSPPQNDFSVPPIGKDVSAKLNPQPKQTSALTKPKIDVKIMKSLPNTKTTKQVMKLAKEISMK